MGQVSLNTSLYLILRHDERWNCCNKNNKIFLALELTIKKNDYCVVFSDILPQLCIALNFNNHAPNPYNP